MDSNTWNNLSKSEQDEIRQMSSDFIKMVLESNSRDGYDFIMKHEIRHDDENFFIIEILTCKKFGYFTSKSKNVIEALMTDAAQNHGR